MCVHAHVCVSVYVYAGLNSNSKISHHAYTLAPQVKVSKELLSKVNQILDENDNSICDFKTEFQSSLEEIGRAAVTDYLEK